MDRKETGFPSEGCHLQLVLGASERTESVNDTDTLQSFSSFSLFPSPIVRGDETSSSVKHRVYTYARGTDDSRFHRVPRTFYGTLPRESSGNRRARSRSVTDSERGSNRPGIEPSSLHATRGVSSRDRLYLAIRVTNYGEKNTISVKNATSIRKDAGLPRSS